LLAAWYLKKLGSQIHPIGDFLRAVQQSIDEKTFKPLKHGQNLKKLSERDKNVRRLSM